MNAKAMAILVALAIVCGGVLAVGAGPGSTAKHRVVFQVTSEGDEQWDAVLGNVENMREALGAANTEVAVIGHSKGLGMLLAAGNKHAERMRKLADEGVAFIACENTMRKKDVTRDQLLPFATTVDSGVAEVVRRQEQGWSYLKSGI